MNNTIIKQVLIFAAGAVAGSVATYVAMKNKCEKRIQEDVESVKKALSLYDGNENGQDTVEYDEEEPEHITNEARSYYNSLIHETGYMNRSEPAVNVVRESAKKDYIPEVIPPEEYGEIEEYDQLEYTYYADCVIVDSDGELVDGDEVKDTIGFESLNHFGDYEADSVFVKNIVRHAYYAVYKDLRKYSEVQILNKKPRRMEE